MTVELVEPKEQDFSSDDDDDDDEGNFSVCSRLLPSTMAKSSHQVLDLRTMRNNVESNNLLKSISPSLGPNIEISLVPSDSGGSGGGSSSSGSGGSSNTQRRDEKRRKSMQLPIPALRKISTGELTMKVKNGGGAVSGGGRPKTMGSAAAARNRAEAYVSVSSGPLETTLTPASFCAPMMADGRKQMADICVPQVEQYLTAFYNTLVGAAAVAATDSSTGAGGSHGLQLSPEELVYMSAPAAYLRQQRQELSKRPLNDKSVSLYDSYHQKLASILKNNTVSIIENYDEIVSD